MAAIVDYDLGDQLQGSCHCPAKACPGIVGSWYLHGPANGPEGAENVGCYRYIHGILASIPTHDALQFAQYRITLDMEYTSEIEVWKT